MKLNKKQKRTATIASMAALLAVVLGMGGQTFAKYITTTQTETHTAVVAKWGFVLQQKSSTPLFKNNYTDAVSSNPIVAPGTSGSIECYVTGLAEVNAKITFTLTDYAPVYLTKGTQTYYPITWKVNGVAFDLTSDVGAGHAETSKEIESFTYTAGTELKADDANTALVTISWEWNINYASSGITDLSVDDADTILGNIAAGKGTPTGYSANTNLSFAFNATIEQTNTVN